MSLKFKNCNGDSYEGGAASFVKNKHAYFQECIILYQSNTCIWNFNVHTLIFVKFYVLSPT